MLDALRDAAAAAMVSICTGAFALAAAGVLDGRRATTHWRDAADLAARYPARRASSPDVLYVDEGDVLTSAGVASGLDLCLHILRRDHGAALARTDRPADRRPAAPRGRPGAVRRAAAPAHAGGSLAATRAWALERLHEPLTVRDLAAHAHVSERTFARRFRAETGTPVLQWLLAQRVDAARAALEASDRDDRRDRRTAAASAPPRTCASTSAARSRRPRRPTAARSSPRVQRAHEPQAEQQQRDEPPGRREHEPMPS